MFLGGLGYPACDAGRIELGTAAWEEQAQELRTDASANKPVDKSAKRSWEKT